MKQDYLILDARPLSAFRDKTFSGFKKTDVYKALIKSMDEGKVEDTCFWIIECIVSGYSVDIIDKLCAYGSKIVHINNPTLPEYLLRKYITFQNSINHIKRKDKDQYIHLRNTQSIRNCLVDIAITLCLSNKTKRYDKYIKVNPKTEFAFSQLQKNLNATMQLLPQSTIRFTDPEELRIILNELLFHLKNSHGGYERACFWIGWLIQWEKREKSMKRKFEIEEREIRGLDPKYRKDMIWLPWSVVHLEAEQRSIDIRNQINALYHLFIYNYTSGKRASRLPYLYQSIGFLTLPHTFTIPLRTNLNLFLQTQCAINMRSKQKKVNEVKTYVEPPKPSKKPTGALKEVIESRMNLFKDLDMMGQ